MKAVIEPVIKRPIKISSISPKIISISFTVK
jgi:hypothetical protein